LKIGTIVKEKRKELSMTQKDLAEGICVQALISRIENNEVIPSSEKLEKIAKKLNLSRDFFSKSNYSEIDHEVVKIDLTVDIIKKYLEKRDYKSIEYLIEANKYNIEKLENQSNILFFKWIEATLYHHKTKDSDRALAMLNNLPLFESDVEISIQILNAIGRLYYLREEYDNAIEAFTKGLQHLFELNNNNYFIKSKLLFNYSLAALEVGNIKKALNMINEGIELLVENSSIYLLGDFYYQKGRIFREMQDYSEAKEYYKIAFSLFVVQNNEQFKNLTQIEINEINLEIKERRDSDD
jgi:transcriptional regulator with XRE-family HTH domain